MISKCHGENSAPKVEYGKDLGLNSLLRLGTAKYASSMKIAVVGATGPTGLEVVKQALERGHSVVAYVRRPEALMVSADLTVVAGQLADTQSMAQAFTSCDVVLCTLGTRSFKERTFMSDHLPLVTKAMKQAGVDRLVLMSALGGGQLPGKVNWFSKRLFTFMSKYIFGDRTLSEQRLNQEGIKWSAAYPAFLTNGPKLKDADVIDMENVIDVWGMQISRATVASVLLDLAEDTKRPKRRVAVAAKGKVKH